MATITSANSTQYEALFVAEPASRQDAGLIGGVVRRSYAEYTVASADEIASDGVITMMKLPKGARIVGAKAVMPASGATGQFNIGWPVNGDLAADPDALFAGLDPGVAAVDSSLASTSAAWNKKLEAEATVQLVCLEITADSGGDSLELEVSYVID